MNETWKIRVGSNIVAISTSTVFLSKNYAAYVLGLSNRSY